MIDPFTMHVPRCWVRNYAAAIVLASVGCALVCAVGAPEFLEPPAAAEPAETVAWHDTLDAGLKDAARRQRPMLVIYGAHGCVPCQELQKELERPEVREKLAHWTLVHLDVDRPEPGQGAYAGAIPALRIATSAGKTLASREGFVSGKDLIRWLEDSAPKAGEVNPDLARADAPDSAATGRLLAMLNGGDAEIREAAIRRLAPWRQLVAKPAVAAFAGGNLRTRLALLDLLQEWKAPVQGIDPWQPQTIGAGQLDALGKWAAAIKGPSTGPASPDAARIAAAQSDLTALLRAADAADARIISGRLARLGPALLPEVLRRLKETGSDRERERLTALRYRLVATEALLLGWPGGVERLASTDPVTRHGAAEELSKRTVPADGPLLLELFSDPDPLVREISLRGLQQVGGNEGASMLVKLLHDPAPNVRAAVLKQLADQPDPRVTPAVVEYIAQEKDVDLIVHAVRVLRAAKNEGGIKCLIGLLNHESWRVRAEAIDSVADIAGNSSYSKEELAGALVNHLDDPDAFVAGRALEAMKPLMGMASADALNQAVKRHPELAMEAIKLLASQGNDFSVRKALRNYCVNDLPAVRAAAVVALADMAPQNCRDEIQAALHDKVDDVRAAGAMALFAVLNHNLPHEGMIDKPSFFGIGGGPERVNPVEWLESFRSGKTRAAWYGDCLADLQAMLKSNQQPMRLAAAYPLIALGHEDEALPIVQAAAKADSSVRESACQILPWLPWNKRFPWTRTLLATELTDAMTINLAAQLAVIPDRRSADAAWFLLDGANGGGALDQVYDSLRALYLADEPDKPDPAGSPDARALKEAARNYIQKGSDNQRLVALALLCGSATTDAAELAKKMYEDPKTGRGLREAAFQVMLVSQPAAQAQRSASATLGDKSAQSVQPLALKFLALGSDSISQVHGIYLSATTTSDVTNGNDSRSIDLKPPAGVTADLLLPYLKNDDRELAACADYLMCLLGRKECLADLLANWKQQGPSRDLDITVLVYRAIAALDDDAQTPVLEQIYRLNGKGGYDLGDFCRALGNMHGPRALKLRKGILDEVGTQRLR